MKVIAFATIAFGVAAVACLDATEILVEVTTDVPCSSLGPVTISLGHPNQDISTYAETTTAGHCDSSGTIGSLVIKPATSDDETIVVVVTATNNGTSGSDCAASSPARPECIVTSRQVSFSPHTTVDLPIELQQACAGVACAQSMTCAGGACVPQ